MSEHFGPSGRPKLSFDTAAEAQAWIAEHHQTGAMHTYRCTFCGDWHMASNHGQRPQASVAA